MQQLAPYPADTRAKGWRFELDLERVRQSDTWALTQPEARPWLFMLWCEAWLQTPCGSLPSDAALLAARIGMPPKMWAKHRATLMRGWVAADDGRLYHPTITELVLAMLKRKDAEKTRKTEYRARMDAERDALAKSVPTASGHVPRDRRGTDAGQTLASHGTDDTGTGTGTGTGTSKDKDKDKDRRGIPPTTPARKRAAAVPESLPPWLDAKAWGDYEAMRTAQRKAPTPAARILAVAKLAELRDAGHDPTEVLRQSTFRGWVGLFAVKPDAATNGNGNGNDAYTETYRQRAARQRAEEISPGSARKAPWDRPPPETIDVTSRTLD